MAVTSIVTQFAIQWSRLIVLKATFFKFSTNSIQFAGPLAINLAPWPLEYAVLLDTLRSVQFSHQEQAPKQRCTFRPTTFSSVQFSPVRRR